VSGWEKLADETCSARLRHGRVLADFFKVDGTCE
jgi:hypothetical protein